MRKANKMAAEWRNAALSGLTPGQAAYQGEGVSSMTNEYCARCGKRLADNPGGLRKYCPDCAKARRRQSWREYQHRRRSGELVPKAVCERCGVEYKKPAIVRGTARIAGTLWRECGIQRPLAAIALRN